MREILEESWKTNEGVLSYELKTILNKGISMEELYLSCPKILYYEVDMPRLSNNSAWSFKNSQKAHDLCNLFFSLFLTFLCDLYEIISFPAFGIYKIQSMSS